MKTNKLERVKESLKGSTKFGVFPVSVYWVWGDFFFFTFLLFRFMQTWPGGWLWAKFKQTWTISNQWMRFKLDLILPTGQNLRQHPNRSTNEMLDLMLLETTAPRTSRLKTLTSLLEKGTDAELIFLPSLLVWLWWREGEGYPSFRNRQRQSIGLLCEH